MSEEKEKFLNDLQDKLRIRLDEKFRKGDTEHQGDLMNVNALEEAFDELVDGLTYVYVQMKNGRNDYERGYAEGFRSAVQIPDKEEID